MEPVSIQIIGCGDAFGSGGQLNTCFYVKSKSVKALLDCGASSLPALKTHKVPIQDIDVVVISHFHGDHYGGLPFLLLYLGTYGQHKILHIVSPEGCREKLSALLNLLYPGTDLMSRLKLEFLAYKEGQLLDIGGLRIEGVPVVHSSEAKAHGVRMELDGKIISFSGDTEWTEKLLPIAEQADLFICECCFYTMEVKGHMNYLQLQANLHRLRYKKILLTHFDREMLLNKKSINLDYAVEGMVCQV
jgi:ribonuclease BN (tRNA processing enzyme)